MNDATNPQCHHVNVLLVSCVRSSVQAWIFSLPHFSQNILVTIYTKGRGSLDYFSIVAVGSILKKIIVMLQS